MKRFGLYFVILLIFTMSLLPLYSLVESLRIGKIPKEVTRLHMNTNNTTRVWADDYQELQKNILEIKNPEGENPDLVILAGSQNWVQAVTATSLLAPPVNSTLLLVDKNKQEEVLELLKKLRPKGENNLNGVQVLVVGQIGDIGGRIKEQGFKVRNLNGDNADIAQKIDDIRLTLTQEKSPWVILIDQQMDYSYALPSINWAVHRGTPILVVDGKKLPKSTEAALRARDKKLNIYVMAPADKVFGSIRALKKIETVNELANPDPIQNAIDFARYYDNQTGFGWQTTTETVEGGKNFLLVHKDDWQFAVLGAQIFNKGLFGPLLLTSEVNRLPAALEKFYWETSPDWWVTPAEGPYNHTWLLGSTDKISYPVQGRLNFLHEITNYESQGNQGISGLEAITIVWYALAVSGAIWIWFHLSTRMFQLSPFMRLIWVLVVLSLGPVGLWAYYTCYKGYGHQVASGEFPRPLWVKVLAATCSTIGSGMPTMIGTAFVLVFLIGAPLLLNRGPLFVLTGPMAQTIFWSYLAAVLVNAFVFVPIMLAFKENSGYWDTVKANWLTVLISMTAISIGMMSTMWWIMMEYLDMMPEESNLLWWGSMYAANIAGLITGYIGNWTLVIRGEKKGTM